MLPHRAPHPRQRICKRTLCPRPFLLAGHPRKSTLQPHGLVRWLPLQCQRLNSLLGGNPRDRGVLRSLCLGCCALGFCSFALGCCSLCLGVCGLGFCSLCLGLCALGFCPFALGCCPSTLGVCALGLDSFSVPACLHVTHVAGGDPRDRGLFPSSGAIRLHEISHDPPCGFCSLHLSRYSRRICLAALS